MMTSKGRRGHDGSQKPEMKAIVPTDPQKLYAQLTPRFRIYLVICEHQGF